MPRFSIFVRDEDLETFLQIQDRPRWVHDAISGTSPEPYNAAVKERKKVEKIIAPFLQHVEAECPQHHVRISVCAPQH